MNYPQSQEIFEEIKKAKRVLVNCHSSPDADSVGSAYAMAEILKYLGKEFQIICPNNLPKNFEFLKTTYPYEIQKVDFSKFDFSKWDLFITLDTSSWSRVTGNKECSVPDISIIVIDHHKTNQNFGNLNLVDAKSPANCELLYFVFQDWGIKIDREVNYPDVSKALLTGIMGDTGGLRFNEADGKTLQVATDLMRLADKNEIILNLYQSYNIKSIKLWGEIFSKIQIDETHKFVWAAIEVEDKVSFGIKSEVADMIFQSVEDTDFGIVILGRKDGVVVSFRSRTGIDVSQIAAALGGGGHQWSSAAKIQNMPFTQAVEKILSTAKEYAKKYQK